MEKMPAGWPPSSAPVAHEDHPRRRAMTQEQKVIRVKVGVLELAKQLGNVSQACLKRKGQFAGSPTAKSEIGWAWSLIIDADG